MTRPPRPDPPMTPAGPAGVEPSAAPPAAPEPEPAVATEARAATDRGDTSRRFPVRLAGDGAIRRAAEISLILVMLAWAANFVVVKAATTVFPPIGFAFLRFSLAAIVLVVLLRALEGPIRLPRRALLELGGLGLVGFSLYQMLWTPALANVAAGDSALLIATSPVMTVLLAGAIGLDRLTPTRIGGALVAFAGVAFVIAGGVGLELGGALAGYGLTLGAAACWAIYSALGASVLRRHSPLRATTVAVTAGALGMAPIGLAQLTTVDWSLVPPAAWAGLVYSGLLPAGLTNVLVFAAIGVLGPARTSVFQFLVPAFAVVLGAVFLAEGIRAGQVLGGAIIVAGILLTRRDTWPLRGRPAAAPPAGAGT
jgi:drug/metabolite transporter (DMT)-like permease